MSFQPTPEQAAVIDAATKSETSALVVAGPGTGKTRTAIEAARQKLGTEEAGSKRQILFLSFSNAAVHRLMNAAGISMSPAERTKLRFMTYHSCAAELLKMYGRFVGLPPKVSIGDKLEEQLMRLESQWGDESETIHRHLLEVARTRGVLAFDVLIPLATTLLNGSRKLRQILCRRYALIIADEFQDTSEPQWRLLQALGEDRQVLAFGDPDQIIYASMHAATTQRMEQFLTWKSIGLTQFSTRNFRCDRAEILQFATSLLRGHPNTPSAESGVQVLDAKYRSRLRLCLALIWKHVRDKVDRDASIAFLAPSTSLAEQIAVDLRTPSTDSRLRIPIHARIARDEAAHDAITLALTAMRDLAVDPNETTKRRAAVAAAAMNAMWNPRKKVTSKDVEKIVADLASAGSSFSELLGELEKSKDVSGQIGSFLKCFRERRDFLTCVKRIDAQGMRKKSEVVSMPPQLLLFEEARLARQPKGLHGYHADEGKTHVLTYHKSKGREFDFVVLIVDARQESTKQALDEKRRLYYVSATRAKKWLGIVHFGQQLGPVLGPVLRPV